jgi:hypothetical protein
MRATILNCTLADAELAQRDCAGCRLERGDDLDRGEVERRRRGHPLERDTVHAGDARGHQRRAGDGEQRQRAPRVLDAGHERLRPREDRDGVQGCAAEEGEGAGARKRVTMAPRELGEHRGLSTDGQQW